MEKRIELAGLYAVGIGKIADHLKVVHAVEFTEDLRKKANDLIRLVEA